MRLKPKILWIVLLLAAMATFIFQYEFIRSWSGVPFEGDWDAVRGLDVYLQSLLKYGQYPQWNPYDCGGMEMYSSPGFGPLSPFFWLHALFGAAEGFRVGFFILYLLAFWGTFLLCSKILKLSLPACLFAAFIFTFSRYIAVHNVHLYGMMSFSLIPLVLFFFLKGLEQNKGHYFLYSVLMLSLMFLNGGIYAIAYTLVLLTILTLTYSLKFKPDFILFFVLLGLLFYGRVSVYVIVAVVIATVPYFWFRRNLRATRRLWLIYFLTLGLFALCIFAKLLPIYQSDLQKGRRPPKLGFVKPSEAWELVFLKKWPVHDGNWIGHVWHKGEYDNYAGQVTLLFLILGTMVLIRRKRFLFLLPLGLFYLLMCGHYDAYAPANALFDLPMFRNLRVPSRATVVFGLLVALIAGIGANEALLRARALKSKQTENLIIGILLGLMIYNVIDIIIYNRYFFSDKSISYVAGQLKKGPHPFRQVMQVPQNEKYLRFLENTGLIHCEAYDLYMEGTNKKYLKNLEKFLKYPAEVSLLRQSPGDHIKFLNWSPQRLKISVQSGRENTVVIRQNYHPYWQTTYGQIINQEGLIGVSIPSGQKGFEVYFEVPHYLRNILISLGVMIGIIFILIFRYLQKKMRQG